MYNKACCFDLEYNNELKMNDKLEENECDTFVWQCVTVCDTNECDSTLSANIIHEDCNV